MVLQDGLVLLSDLVVACADVVHGVAYLVDIEQRSDDRQGKEEIPNPEICGSESVLEATSFKLVADARRKIVEPHKIGDAEGYGADDEQQEKEVHGPLAVVSRCDRVYIRGDVRPEHKAVKSAGEQGEKNELHEASRCLELPYGSCVIDHRLDKDRLSHELIWVLIAIDRLCLGIRRQIRVLIAADRTSLLVGRNIRVLVGIYGLIYGHCHIGLLRSCKSFAAASAESSSIVELSAADRTSFHIDPLLKKEFLTVSDYTTFFAVCQLFQGNTAQPLCVRCDVHFFVRLPKFDAGRLAPFKENLGNMTEKWQADDVQRR